MVLATLTWERLFLYFDLMWTRGQGLVLAVQVMTSAVLCLQGGHGQWPWGQGLVWATQPPTVSTTSREWTVSTPGQSSQSR